MLHTLHIVARQPHLLPGLIHYRLAHWKNQRLLSKACRLVPSIIASLPSRMVEHGPATWTVHHATWTQTNVAVFIVGPHGQPPRVVLKLPGTPQGCAGLQWQRHVQATLRADPRLEAWWVLLPTPLAAGEITGQFYVAEQALPGHPALRLLADPATRKRAQTAAAVAISALHRHTAHRVTIDTGWFERWIAAPLRCLRHVVAPLPSAARAKHDAAIERLGSALRQALWGRTVCVGWIHGDLWPGNLLVDAHGELLGIVDWDRAAPDGLPFHDVFHLLLFTRKQVRQRWDERDIVAGLIGRMDWTAHERAVLDAAAPALPANVIDERTMLLMYWLRYTAATLDAQPRLAYDREYMTNNVALVLQCV